MSDIAKNLTSVRHEIATAASVAKRDAADIKLIAVSKFHPVEAVREAIAAGQLCFGENRVQEAAGKFAGLRDETPGLELHLIGPLQTNKAEEAVRLFDIIQTVDREKLAAALAKAVQKAGRAPKFYVEVNVGREAQKAGVMPEALEAFLKVCSSTYDLPVTGLMCIPPQGEDAAPHFTALKKMADQFGLPHVSMGMSGDFADAINCGATEVRVGTAIFGNRQEKT